MNAILPQRKPKKVKRESRWHSPKHLRWIREFACCNCGSMDNIEAAHVRMRSGAGMGQIPDDFLAVPLCHQCHRYDQHQHGEETFWRRYAADQKQTVWALLDMLAIKSPEAADIRRVKKEREA
ncbi:DUF1364 domain-containing protein [Croceicoccus sp. Ery15]|uniref:DUF1364 domain-containing protein n=1 Tax=Croceicoccus sp. Ery15 TaxID=1703338 RepID=UPI001E2EF9A6|nr:DUF1364 domain-containing protein [Croceicoccus sp. Ery15]